MRIELKDENQEEPQQIDENDIRNKHEIRSDEERRSAHLEKREAGQAWAWKRQASAISGPIISRRWQPS